ncbi:MAG: sensor domain-containing diguanylate cyclase [Spirochaetaceae bacterium]|nr:sensor domain-containing diguanylate cyclase [Spirochaetaceae bacterium]
MRSKFIVFSALLLLLIFIFGSVSFVLLMRQIQHSKVRDDLLKIVEIERLKLESSVNGEIAIVLKMANSPLIIQYFTNPGHQELEKMALEEIAAYRLALAAKSVFWVNDTDKIFHTDDISPFMLDPADPENYWYPMTLYETDVYNFNINYNPDLNVTNLWINVPVFDSAHNPVGMVGTGINLSEFISVLYHSYSEAAHLYFFNTNGEITGARNIDLAAQKVSLDKELGPAGAEILAGIRRLGDGKEIYYEAKDGKEAVAFSAIPALKWYIAVVYYYRIGDYLKTGMTVLFVMMMVIILSGFVIFNLFVAGLLEPLRLLIKTVNQIKSEWDLSPRNETRQKNEIETLGELLDMTTTDQLTGIYNRRYMDGNLKIIIKTLSRTKAKLSLLMIDIDFFKNYNDTYGHDMGDKCLKATAETLAQCITREEDFVARYGGEEFAVVLPNTDEDGVRQVADKLLKKIRENNIPHENSGAADHVTISIGGTTGIVNYMHSASDYIKCADAALYESKHNGRNRYTFLSFRTAIEYLPQPQLSAGLADLFFAAHI